MLGPVLPFTMKTVVFENIASRASLKVKKTRGLQLFGIVNQFEMFYLKSPTGNMNNRISLFRCQINKWTHLQKNVHIVL